MATPPVEFGGTLIGMPLIQVGFVAAGIALVWRELRELPARVDGAVKSAKPGAAQDTRQAVLAACVKVLTGSLMMALFGLTLLGVTAGLWPAEKALNSFALLMIPAIAVLAYVSAMGVPDGVARLLLKE
ncbi:MAG: hypothetical protein ABL893_02440 [Hyphomicrobium sp.]